jgi:hypothetical protein
MIQSVENNAFQARDPDGKLFVDRNGIAFKDILEFLRTGLPIVPSVLLSTLQVEAEYYCIANFETIQEKKKAKKDVALPSEILRREVLRASTIDRGAGQTRLMFSRSEAEDLPSHILQHAGHTKGGTLYINLYKIKELSFSRIWQPGQVGKEGASDDVDMFIYERNVRTSWIDKEKFDIVECVWDMVAEVDRRLAKVSAFEQC